jgi:hypothetical protein
MSATPKHPNPPDGTAIIRCTGWLAVMQRALADRLLMFGHLTRQSIVRRLLISRLQVRKLLINCHLRRCEVRMALCQSRIICLKRGYFSANEPNLRSNSVLCRALYYHPIQVVNILQECIHKHWCMIANSMLGQRHRWKDKVGAGHLLLPGGHLRLQPCLHKDNIAQHAPSARRSLAAWPQAPELISPT